MEKGFNIGRRSFLKASALAGLATLASGTAISAGAASPVQDEEENCIKLGGSAPIEMVSVQLAPGRLIGYVDQGLYAFRGVPYATAERFQSPVPITAYENGWQLALSYGPVSPQDRCMNGTASINSFEFLTPSNGTADMVSNETCQYLNVWTRSLSGKKPVVVFFHGGGLTNGASSELSYYTGEYFAEKENMVFVSVNHRLNVLGYLDMSQYGEQYSSSAIAGEEDCAEALRWVHNNIDKFGGDPSNVTIIGQSGGGIKVSTLACMSDTADLFDKVFVMSGAVSNSNKDSGLANTQKLVDYLGLKPEEVAEKLTSMTYEELYTAATNAGCNWSACYGNGTFETPMIGADGTINPYAARRKWIIGTTFGEFSANGISLVYYQDMDAYLPNISDEDARSRLQASYGSRAGAIETAFRAAYPNDALSHALFINTMTSGGLSRWGLISPSGIVTALNNAGIPVYNYVVNYTMPHFGGQIMHHTGDIPFWFAAIDTVDYQMRGDEKNARKVSNRMADALAAFMESGDPSTKSLKWKPYTSAEHNTMVFDVKSECRADFDRELYELLMNA